MIVTAWIQQRHGRRVSLMGAVILLMVFGVSQVRLSVGVVPEKILQQQVPHWPLRPTHYQGREAPSGTSRDRIFQHVGKASNETASRPQISSAATNQNVTVEHPILKFRKDFSSYLPSSIPVVLWPYMDAAAKKGKATSADVVHVELNGVEESSILTLANASVRTLDPNVVWVTDAKFPYSQWCGRLAEKAHKMQELRRASFQTLIWPIYVVDFTDPPRYPKACPALEEVVGRDHVLYFKRSIVTNRTWNFTTNWLELGQRLPSTTSNPNDRHFEQTPLVVRSDIVQGFADYLAQDDDTNATSKSTSLLANLPRRPRSMDVAHYWPPSKEKAQFSNLRNQISNWLLEKLGSKYQVYCDMIGQHDRVGRRQAQTGYIESMANTKILVVAQRDTYEDHYRLWEALVSGALVVTDPMWTIPESLQNGTHLLIYHSLPEVIRFVEYYLQHAEERLVVAEVGYRAAMSRHRSWHRMEEIILGRPVTTCAKVQAVDGVNEGCPFTVHAIGRNRDSGN